MGYRLEQNDDVQRQLIINADDFGLTDGINRAILELNRAGVLTSTTLMARGAAFRAAIHEAFVRPELSVGCHVVLVDGSPVLHTSELPTLAPGGRFRSSLAEFVRALLGGRIREGEIEAEAAAQITRIQAAGLTVSHLDSHKHTHMFLRVLRPLLRAADACGVTAVRNPFEPLWATRAARSTGWQRRVQVHLLQTQRGAFVRAVRRTGIRTTDGALGVLATGSLDEVSLESILRAAPPGIWELVCHPGYADAALANANTRLVGSREAERTALLRVIPDTIAHDPTLRLINFEQLPSLNPATPLPRPKQQRGQL